VTVVEAHTGTVLGPITLEPGASANFSGVGQFKNIDSADPLLAGVLAQWTYHWFDVHIEDLGEPGSKPRVKPQNCPAAGSGTDAFANPPVFMPANCNCSDFYRIRIYEAFDPASEGPDKTNVIYQVSGYFRRPC